MKKVQFSVAAKAARLIGRENIADVDGALIELIKNAYDADASCVLVKMDIPFPDIPNRLDLPLVTKLLTEKELSNVLSCYTWRINQLVKRTDLSEKEQENLKNILFAYNKIIIADNGYGMTENIVSTTWMHIGTSDKEENVVSPNGRIKTGAKGIGRFALDKLSQYSLMYTKSKESSAVIKWSMNWEQFANAKLIDDVKAEIREVKNSYKDYIQKEFEEYKEVWNEHAWDTGTMIILNPIREPWSKRLFKKVNTNLNSINPIGSVDKFEVVINNVYYSEYNYRTENVEIDPDVFDYRIKIDYDGKEVLQIKLLRNEVDLTRRKIAVEKYGQSITKNIDEFWKRDKV